jgi:hypothetical protein
MQSHLSGVSLLLAVGLSAAAGAERTFDFSQTREGETPPGFHSAVTGVGKPGTWKVVMDDVPSLLPALSPQAPKTSKRAVLAQLSQDMADEHFPLLIFEEETFGDFTLTTRFKTVSGIAEQMAGIAFRIQNETNYYVVRASSLGNNFRFYKVVNGERGTIIGPETPVPAGVWHDLQIECKGNQIRCLLDGRELIPTLTDSSFSSGKVGFWTKSDSVSYFANTRIVYVPRVVPAQALAQRFAKKYSRLLGLEIFAEDAVGRSTRLVGSKDEAGLGRPGGKVERDVISQGMTFYGKEKGQVSVVMPLRDRNGEPIAAVRIVMKPHVGQTEENAIARAAPIVKEIQSQVRSSKDLVD